MDAELTAREQQMVNQAKAIIVERGGIVTRVKITDLDSSGSAAKTRTRNTYRDITIYGTSPRSDKETIQAKVFPQASRDGQFEIYTMKD